jgi:hypothetical protein
VIAGIVREFLVVRDRYAIRGRDSDLLGAALQSGVALDLRRELDGAERRTRYGGAARNRRLPIANVLVITVSSQFVVLMFFNLYIGDYVRGGGQKEMKGMFFGESLKTVNLRLYCLQLSVMNRRLWLCGE